MNNIFIFAMLLTPAFVCAQEKPAVARAEAVKKTVYQTLAEELLKNCEGADKKIAVAGVSYSDGRTSSGGRLVAERITAELEKAGKVKVIERKEIDEVLEKLKVQRCPPLTTYSAKEIGKLLGADWVVTGTLTELAGKELELKARLLVVGSGKTITIPKVRLKKDWQDLYEKLLKDIDNIDKPIDKNAKGC